MRSCRSNVSFFCYKNNHTFSISESYNHYFTVSLFYHKELIMSGSEKLSYLIPRNPSILSWSDRVKLSNPVTENVVKLGLDACEESANGKLKVYLRMKPCQVDVNPYSIYDNTLETEAPSDNGASKKVSRNVGKLVNKFHFTAIFSPDSSQEVVFETCVLSNLQRFIEGKNDLLFAYGTTNAGKTFTMQGTVENPGIIPRAMQFVFKCLGNNIDSISRYQPFRYNELCLLDDEELRKSLVHKNFILNLNLSKYQRHPEMSWKSYKTDTTASNSDYSDAYENETFREMEKNLEDLKYEVDDDCYSVWISMIEIYNEQIYDLLEVPSERQMRVKLGFAEDENGKVYIKNLRYVRVTNGHEAFQVFEFGRANLRLGPTALNYWSSRSHCICTLTLARVSKDGNSPCIALSRFSFCDLAGAERVKKALVEGNRLVESKSINTSLSIFAKCLSVIRENQSTGEKKLVPYRESKLTRLFRDAMMGRETFSIIVNVTPETHLFNETLNVLKFSAVARQIVPVNVVEKPKRVRPLCQRKFANTVLNLNGNCKIDWEGDDVVEMKENEKVVDLEDLMKFIDQLKKQVAEERERADNIEREVRKEFETKFSEIVEQIQKERNLYECENNRIRVVFDREKQRLMKHYEERERRLKRKRVEDDVSDYEEMETQIETLTKDMEFLKSENSSLKELIQQINAKSNVLTKKCSQMQFELSEKDRMLKMYRRRVEEDDPRSEEVVKELENQLLHSKSKNAELKELLDESDFEYKDLLVTNNIIKEENVRLLNDLTATSNVVDDLKKELRDYKAMLSVKRKEIVECKNDDSNSSIFIESFVENEKVYEVVDVEDSQDDVENGEEEEEGSLSSSDELDEAKVRKSLNDSRNENPDDECCTRKNDFNVSKKVNESSISPIIKKNGMNSDSVELEDVMKLVDRLKKEIAEERQRADNIASNVRKELEMKFTEMIEQQIDKERNLFESEKRRIGETFDRKKSRLAECYEEKIKDLMATCNQQSETIKSLNEELKQLTSQVADMDKKEKVKGEELTERNLALMEELDRCNRDKTHLEKLLEEKKCDYEKDKRLNVTFISNLLKKFEAAGFRDGTVRDNGEGVVQMQILEETITKFLEEELTKKTEIELLRSENEALKKNVAFTFHFVASPHEGGREETVNLEELVDKLNDEKVSKIKEDGDIPTERDREAGNGDVMSSFTRPEVLPDSGSDNRTADQNTPDRLSREIEKLSLLRSEQKKTGLADKNTHPSLMKRVGRSKKKGKKPAEPEAEENEEKSNECKTVSDNGKKGKKCTKKLFVKNDFDDIGDLESSFTEPEIPRLRPRKK